MGQWHETTSQTTGFAALGDPPSRPSAEEPRLRAAYQRALPVYERLSAHALVPTEAD